MNKNKVYNIYSFVKMTFAIAIIFVVMLPHLSVNAEGSATEYYGRKALGKMERGELLVQAYDSTVAQADSFKGGDKFVTSYGLSEKEQLTYSEIFAVMRAVENDHPEYTWWSSNTYSIGTDGFTIHFNDGNYYTEATLRNRQAKTERGISEFLKKAGINNSMTELDKAYTLYQVLIGNVTYNIEYLDQSAYAAFVDKQAVCAGYAKAYTLLLQRSGLEASYIPGTAIAGQEEGGHAWVLVKIDGNYYYCDPTLDDGGAVPIYNYFMRTDDDMAGNHVIDNVGYSFPATPGTGLSTPDSTFLISSASVTGGKIYPEKLYVRSGSPVSVYMVPDDDYISEKLLINNVEAVGQDQPDGGLSFEIPSADVDINLTGSFKVETQKPTVLVSASSTYTVMQGNDVTLAAILTTPAGIPIADKTVVINVDGKSYSVTTDEDGTAYITFDPLDLEPNSYEVEMTFEGDANYKSSYTTAQLKVLEKKEIEKVTAGDLVIYATYGGKLEESTDYYYYESEKRLIIYTDKDLTIENRENVNKADATISFGISVTSANLTLNGFNILPTKSKSSGGFGIDASGVKLTLNLVGENSISIPGESPIAEYSIKQYYGIKCDDLIINGSDENDKLDITVGNAGDKSIGIMTNNMTVNGGAVTSVSGDVSEWSFSRSYGIEVDGALIMNGGSVSGTSGKFSYSYELMGTCGIYTEEITLNKGTVTGQGGTAVYGMSMGIYILKDGLTVKTGTIKGYGGKSESDSESTSLGSYGLFSAGDITINSGEIYAEGSEGSLTCGLACGASLFVNGGKVTGIGGDAFGAETLGCLVQEDYLQKAGEVKFSSSAAPDGDSHGLRQCNSTAKVEITGGDLEISGSTENSMTYKGLYAQGGFLYFKGGNVNVRSGKAVNHSAGIYSQNTISIEDGVIDSEGADIEPSESTFINEAFSTGIFGGNNLSIKGGTIRAIGKNAPKSYGIYTYDKVNISAGKIDARGNNAGIDGDGSNITGGSYSLGDTAAATVCGFKVANGYSVSQGDDKDYPYVVSKGDSQGGGSDDKGSDDGGDKDGGNKDGGNKDGGSKDEPVIPKKGTVESDSAGTAEYKVTGTEKNSNGKTVATVTYMAPKGKKKKAAAQTIPENVKLADGSTAVVTGIAANAFKNNKKIKSIVIPKTVKKIDKNAFNGCRNLKKIVFKSSNLTKKGVAKGAFKNISKKAVIYVPKLTTKKQLKNIKAALKKGNAPKTIKVKKK